MAKTGACGTQEQRVLLDLIRDYLLPLRALVLTLRTERDCHLRFVHTHALSAWLRTLANDDKADSEAWHKRLRIDAPESGRIEYRAGECYSFTLIATVRGAGLLQRVLERLQHPEPVPGRDATEESPAFGAHWRLHEARDLFTDAPVSMVDELCALDADTLAEEAALWAGARAPALIWRWLSPARLLRGKQRRGSGEKRFCRDADDLSAALLAERCLDSVLGLLRTFDAEVPQRETFLWKAQGAFDSHVFWIEDDYRPASGAPRPKGGLLGHHRFDGRLPLPWATLFVLGQYLGIGQGTSGGLGRYRLEREDGSRSYRRAAPERAWIERAIEPENLLKAWRHVSVSRDRQDGSEPVDQVDSAEPETDAGRTFLEVLGSRIEALRCGRYEPPPARAAFLPKPDGTLRPMAIPPFMDAVLQRAFAQTLGPALDSLMHPQSYGYRRGRSRRGAAEAIQKARREGYRWLYDADIEDFFGSVRHESLRSRLGSLFDDEPLVELLMRWVGAPVTWQGERHPRRRGLPQGSNLSPLLANLLLDDFDNDMRAAGVKAVRFADDFVLMAKSRRKAEEAGVAARRSLAEHGLALNEGKSATRDLDAGADFPGYLIVGDLALDLAGRTRASEGAATHRLSPEALQVHAARWLMRLGGTSPRWLNEQTLLARTTRR